APAGARILHGSVEGTSRKVEDLAHVDATRKQIVASSVDVVDREDQTMCGNESLAEDDRCLRVVRCYLHTAEVAPRDIDVDAPAELLIESLGAIDVGNAKQDDFELHVYLRFFLFSHFGLSLFRLQ